MGLLHGRQSSAVPFVVALLPAPPAMPAVRFSVMNTHSKPLGGGPPSWVSKYSLIWLRGH